MLPLEIRQQIVALLRSDHVCPECARVVARSRDAYCPAHCGPLVMRQPCAVCAKMR